mgnify:CR=1 FL=1
MRGVSISIEGMGAVLAKTERAQRFYAAATELHNIGNVAREIGHLKASGHVSNMIQGPVAISEIGYGGAAYYAEYVHEGTASMAAEPFLADAVAYFTRTMGARLNEAASKDLGK